MNVHKYFNENDDFPNYPFTGAHGVSPEYWLWDRPGNTPLKTVVDYRNSIDPNMELWLSEIGWDTFDGGNDFHSYNQINEESQANFLMRTFATIIGMGFTKVFMFIDKDDDSDGSSPPTPGYTGGLQFQSSGIVKEPDFGYERKRSFFYLSTMQKSIGAYEFKSIESAGTGSSDLLYIYKYEKSTSDQVYMIWTRRKDSKFDVGTTILNHNLSIPDMVYAELIVPENNNLRGIKSIINVTAGTAVIPTISETPVFLRVTDGTVDVSSVDQSGKILTDTKRLQMISRSKSFQSSIKFNFIGPEKVQVRTVRGKLIWQGNPEQAWDISSVNPGLYFYTHSQPFKGKIIITD